MVHSKQEHILKLIDDYTRDSGIDLTVTDIARLKQKYINDDRDLEVIANELLILRVNALKQGIRIHTLKMMLNHKRFTPQLSSMQVDHIVLGFIKSGIDYADFENSLRTISDAKELIAYIDSLNQETVVDEIDILPPRHVLANANNYHLQLADGTEKPVILEKLGLVENSMTEVTKVLVRDINGNILNIGYLKSDSLHIILDNEVIISNLGTILQVPVAEAAKVSAEKMGTQVSGIISYDIAKENEEVILLVDVFDKVKDRLSPKDTAMLSFHHHHQNDEQPYEVIESVIRMIDLLPDIQDRDKKACRKQLLESLLFDAITNQSDRNWFNMAIVYNPKTKRYRFGESFDNGVLCAAANKGKVPLIGHEHQMGPFEILRQLYQYYFEDIQYLSSRIVNNKNLILDAIQVIINNNTSHDNALYLNHAIMANIESVVALHTYYEEQYLSKQIMAHLTTGQPTEINYIAIRKARETEQLSVQACREVLNSYEKGRGRIRCVQKS